MKYYDSYNFVSNIDKSIYYISIKNCLRQFKVL